MPPPTFPDARLRRAGVPRRAVIAAMDRWSAATYEDRAAMAAAVSGVSDSDLRAGAVFGVDPGADVRPPDRSDVPDSRPVVRPTEPSAADVATPSAAVAPPAPASVPEAPVQPLTDEYADVLRTVNGARAYAVDHPERAAQLLAAEQAGQARKSLVTSLQHIVDRVARG